MPIFTTVASAIVGTTALTGIGATIATSVVAAGLAYGTGHLLGVFDQPDVAGGGAVVDEGVDVLLGPNTRNRLPILYGTFMTRGLTVYAETSDDRQTLHYVIALGEGPITGITKIYWNEWALSFDDSNVVNGATNDNGDTTDRLNGLITVHTYNGNATGNNSTYLEGLSSTWTSNHKMTNIAYAVVSIEYNRDKEITGLGDMRFIGTAPISNPSVAVKDLLENSRYGLNLDAALIDSASFTAAQTYFDELITYTDTDSASQTQKRHRVNGVLNTNDSVLERAEVILLGSNSSLRWSNGKWGIFVNKEEDAVSFTFTEDNVIGSVNVVETGLNNLYNHVEVQYGRNERNNWQTATTNVYSPDSVRYPNELDRSLTLQLPLVSTSIEAKAAATVILNQGRQQLTVDHVADATAMPLEAGDVVQYTLPNYGWSSKLFRIVNVTEMESGGALQYKITAVEYADAIYDYGTLNEDDVAPNAPTITDVITPIDDLTISNLRPMADPPRFDLSWTVPNGEFINQFDIHYSATNNFSSADTMFLKGIRSPGGQAYTPASTVSDEIVGIPMGTWYFWVVAANDIARSGPSNEARLSNWNPAATTVGSFQEVNLFSENTVADDPGSPGDGTDGSGNSDWYEFDPESSSEDYPHWQATGTAEIVDGESRELQFTFSGDAADVTFTPPVNRVLDFAVTGTSGDEFVETTPNNQEYEFTFSGTVGQEQTFFNARPEITNFVMSGQAANAAVGAKEQWVVETSGTTDDTLSSENEEFYIYPQGTSNTYTPESFTFTPSGDTANPAADHSFDLKYEVDGVVTRDDAFYFYQSGFLSGPTTLTNSTSIEVVFYVPDTATNRTHLNTFFGFSGPFNGQRTVDETTGDIAVTDGTSTFTVSNITEVDYRVSPFNPNALYIGIIAGNATVNGSGNLVDESDWDVTLEGTLSTPVQTSVTVTLDSVSNTYALANAIVGGANVGDALNTAIGTDFVGWTKTFNSSTGAITFTADDDDTFHTGSITKAGDGTLTFATANVDASGTASTIRIEIPTDDIDETIELGSNLTGTNLLNDILAKLQAVTEITDEFTVSSASEDINDDEVNEPIIKLVANDITNHTLDATFTGGLTGSLAGSLLDGSEATTATSISIAYPTGLDPSSQSITFTAASQPSGIASQLATLVDGHGDLTAQQSTITPKSDAVLSSTDPDVGGNRTRTYSWRFKSNVYEVVLIDDAQPGVFFIGDDTTSYPLLNNGFSQSGVPSATRVEAETSIASNIGSFTRFHRSNASNLVGFYLRVSVSNGARALYRITSMIDQHNVNIERVGGFTTGTTPNPNSPYNSNYSYSVRHVAPSVFDPIDFFDVDQLDYTESSDGRFVLITSDADGNYASDPVITVTTQGTGTAAFELDKVQDGETGNGTLTEYSISVAGTEVESGTFTAGSSASSMAAQLRAAIDDLSTHSASGTSTTARATSTANSGDDITVTITAGTNGTDLSSSNNAAVARTVTQVGLPNDVSGGQDSVVTVNVGGQAYYTGTYDGDTLAQIVSNLATGVSTDNSDFTNHWTATVNADNTAILDVSADFNGATPSMSIAITPGSTATVDNDTFEVTETAATLAVSTNVIDNGSPDVDITGRFSTFSIVQGASTIVSNQELDGSSTSAEVASVIRTAINNAAGTMYSATVTDSQVTATSTFTDTTPDLTITIDAGQDDDGTDADLAISKTITTAGDPGGDVDDGTLSSFTVTQGSDTLVASTDISDASDAEAVAEQIRVALNNSGSDFMYTGSRSGAVLTLTSTFEGTSPDLAITLSSGTNSDSTTPDIAVVKDVLNVGVASGLSYSNTEWDYYIISREQQGDGDTTDTNNSGQIISRRGIVLDSDAFGANHNTHSTTSFTSSGLKSQLILRGDIAMAFFRTQLSSGSPILATVAWQYTTDDPNDSPTWFDVPGTQVASITIASTTFSSGAGDYAITRIPFTSVTGQITASTEYHFRAFVYATQGGVTIASPSYLAGGAWNTLLLEELLP